MFKPTILALAALAGQAAAFTTCEPGRTYCGYELIENQPEPDRTLWIARINATLTEWGRPITVDSQRQSTFRCLPGGVTVQWTDDCLSHPPGNGCMPRDNNNCDGTNSCCA